MELTDELYAECSGLIMQAVNHLAIRCPNMDRDELVGEAGLIFCQAARAYDPSRGAKFTTYLVNQLKALTSAVRRSNRHALELTGPVRDGERLVDILDTCGTRKADALGPDYLSAMTADARTVVDMFFAGDLDHSEKSARHLARSARYSVTPRSAYMKRLRSIGWTWQRTQDAFASLSGVLNNFRLGLDVHPSAT